MNQRHWIPSGAAIGVLLVTLTQVHAQSLNMDSSAMFQGRPAMSGAQAGMGAMAGPPQGGIGLQGTEGAERGLHLRPPSGIGGSADTGTNAMGNSGMAVTTTSSDFTTRTTPNDIVKRSDTGIARDQRSATSRSKRAAKRIAQRARHGVSPIDSSANAGS